MDRWLQGSDGAVTRYFRENKRRKDAKEMDLRN